MSNLSYARSVAWSAFLCGSLRSVCLRGPAHARSGVVLVCAFGSRSSAGRFAVRWAGRLGLSVFVRPHPLGWSVSVPVVRSSSRAPRCFGRQLFWSGGLRGFASALRRSGIVWGV